MQRANPYRWTLIALCVLAVSTLGIAFTPTTTVRADDDFKSLKKEYETAKREDSRTAMGRIVEKMGATTAAGLKKLESGTRVWVGGVVTHRQRPATAGGTLFINLEDETGLINVVCSRGCWIRHRQVARSEPALLIRGRLEASEGVYNVIAEKIEPLLVAAAVPSRDFR